MNNLKQDQINPDIFRDFSIRGLADSELTDEVSTQIGYGIGEFFIRRNGNSIAIGRDIRLSSERISKAVINGILQTGISVIDIGVVPTPILNFAADFYHTDGGVMITASHNPPEYNGLKIRAGATLRSDELQEIYHLAIESPLVRVSTLLKPSLPPNDPITQYLEQITLHAASNIHSLKIVVDGNNGTNGVIVPDLLRFLGHVVTELNCEPDGAFPHGNPDPTATDATASLSKLIKQKKADVGFAYDGDGDRFIVVDNEGLTLAGDQLLMLLARFLLNPRKNSENPDVVVYEVLCSQAVADDVSAFGGLPIMVPSGYYYLQKAMNKHDAILGGELSGHFFFRDAGFRFDDSILATVKILNLLTETKQPLSDLAKTLPSYYTSPEIRLPCADNVKATIVEKVRQKYQNVYPLETIDGVRIRFPDGWALVRQSNTQPIISMRFEARNAGPLENIQKEIISLVALYIEQS